MSAEAWIALVALALPVVGGVIWGCVQFAMVRRDVREIKRNHLPHILRVLQKLPCSGRKPPSPQRKDSATGCRWP